MRGRILWIDNDRVFLSSHIVALEAEGFEVVQAYTLTDGGRALQSGKYDLLILDVMMPVAESEEGDFPPGDTNSGHKAGLLFYKKLESIAKRMVPVLVFTIREDSAIRSDLVAAGLPEHEFMTKSEGADTANFLNKVKKVLAEAHNP